MPLSSLIFRPRILATASLLAVNTLLAASVHAQTTNQTTTAAAMAAAAAPAAAQDSPAASTSPISAGPKFPPNTVLIHNETAQVLQSDYDAAMARIPENIRGGFGLDPNRINTLLQNLLADKTLAAQARKEGIDKDPLVQARIQLEADRVLTGLVVERETAEWRKVFNALPNIDAAAHDEWVMHSDKYSGAPQYQLTVLLFGTPPHSPDEARRMADDARTQLLAGADMTKMAREQSDDAATKANGGKVDWTTPGELGTVTAGAVARLAKPGDISVPIKSPAGYQIIRLDAKRPGKITPFEEAKPRILDQLRTAYVDGMVADQLRGIKTSPAIVVNQPAVDALVVTVDPEYMRQLTQEAARNMGQKRPRGGKKPTLQMGSPAAADDATEPADAPDPGK